MDGSWLDDKVRVPNEFSYGLSSTAQHLSPEELRRVQGESIVVDWDALPGSTVVVRLRMIGPRLDTGDCSGGVALARGVLTYCTRRFRNNARRPPWVRTPVD